MSAESMNDAEAFYLYSGEQLHLDAWRKQREYDETVAAVREGVRDMEAGRMRPVCGLLDEINGPRDGH